MKLTRRQFSPLDARAYRSSPSFKPAAQAADNWRTARDSRT